MCARSIASCVARVNPHTQPNQSVPHKLAGDDEPYMLSAVPLHMRQMCGPASSARASHKSARMSQTSTLHMLPATATLTMIPELTMMPTTKIHDEHKQDHDG